MNQNKERYLIAIIIFIVVLGFSIFCGISISNMTGFSKPTETEAPSSESLDESEETKETLIPPLTKSPDDEKDDTKASDESEDEAKKEGEQEEEKKGSVDPLSESEINQIYNGYSGNVKSFYTNGNRDERNISKIALSFSAEFADKFKNTFVFTDVTRPTTSLNIILNMEYGQTEPLLTVLGQKGVKATFFINYNYATTNPGIVQRMIAEGHDVGSLGASTPQNGLALCTLQDQMNDILRLHQYVSDNFNYEMKKFYYLYDKYTDQSVKLVTSLGYHAVFYSNTYADFSSAPAAINADAMCSELASKLHHGAIVALRAANPNGVAAIAGYIDYAHNHGYNFELVP